MEDGYRLYVIQPKDKDGCVVCEPVHIFERCPEYALGRLMANWVNYTDCTEEVISPNMTGISEVKISGGIPHEIRGKTLENLFCEEHDSVAEQSA